MQFTKKSYDEMHKGVFKLICQDKLTKSYQDKERKKEQIQQKTNNRFTNK